LNALEDWNEAGKADLASALPEGTTRVTDAVQFWISRVQSVDASPEQAQEMMVQLGVAADAELPTDRGEREHLLRGVVAFAALTPHFLFR
jgi:hypothetical protein